MNDPAANDVELCARLRQMAMGIRAIHEHFYRSPLTCDTINNALEYGRAQGLEMAADELARQARAVLGDGSGHDS